MRFAGLNFAILAGVAGTLALGTISPSHASPVSTGAAALKAAVPNDVTDVRWRGRGWGYYGGGFATGLAIGALAARPYYYGYGPYYDPYYYGPPPAAYVAPPAPAYVAPYPDPNGPVRQCWVPTDRDRGFGYYRPC
jgi:hypothetical protein